MTPLFRLQAFRYNIVTYQEFGWIIRWVFGFHDQIYWTSVQLVTTVHKWLSHTLSPSSDWTLHGNYSEFQLNSSTTPLYAVVLPQFWSPTLFSSTYNSSARTPRKTPCSVVNNACLLVRYLAMDVLLFRAYALWIGVPSRYLAMDICVKIWSFHFLSFFLPSDYFPGGFLNSFITRCQLHILEWYGKLYWLVIRYYE
jgi:hypothetical protein